MAEELKLDIPVLPSEPDKEPMIEGGHERIQVELYHEAKEVEDMVGRTTRSSARM